jgi:myo-inositol-1(or 4)-monophosphatase
MGFMLSNTLNNSDLDLLKQAARKGGEIGVSFFRKNVRQWTKSGNSPVTEADLAIDVLLRDFLMEVRPDYGWLSEETEDDTRRLDTDRLFIVDPIDGTRGFIAGEDVWTISLAVVENGRPVAGVVYNPVRNEMFSATIKGGAFLNESAISVSNKTSLQGAVLPLSNPLLAIRKRNKNLSFQMTPKVASLAYRLALVSCGRVDGTAIRENACDWDLAAGDLLIHEAGGNLITLERGKPTYNKYDVCHGALSAGTAGVAEEICKLMKA